MRIICKLKHNYKLIYFGSFINATIQTLFQNSDFLLYLFDIELTCDQLLRPKKTNHHQPTSISRAAAASLLFRENLQNAIRYNLKKCVKLQKG